MVVSINKVYILCFCFLLLGNKKIMLDLLCLKIARAWNSDLHRHKILLIIILKLKLKRATANKKQVILYKRYFEKELTRKHRLQ